MTENAMFSFICPGTLTFGLFLKPNLAKEVMLPFDLVKGSNLWFKQSVKHPLLMWQIRIIRFPNLS